MRTHIYLQMHTHTCMYIDICVHTCTHTCIYTCKHTVYIYTHKCIHNDISTQIQLHSFIHTLMHTQTCIHDIVCANIHAHRAYKYAQLIRNVNVASDPGCRHCGGDCDYRMLCIFIVQWQSCRLRSRGQSKRYFSLDIIYFRFQFYFYAVDTESARERSRPTVLYTHERRKQRLWYLSSNTFSYNN